MCEEGDLNLHPVSDGVDSPGISRVARTPTDAIRRDRGDAVTAMPRWWFAGVSAADRGDDCGDKR